MMSDIRNLIRYGKLFERLRHLQERQQVFQRLQDLHLQVSLLIEESFQVQLL